MDVVFAIVHVIVIFAVAFQFYRMDGCLRKIFWPALFVKLAGGICLGLVYTYYYVVSDTFVYFNDASKLVAFAKDDFTSYLRFLFLDDAAPPGLVFNEQRALFLTKITSVFCLLTQGNYWIISLYFSFVSFLSSWFLVRKIAHYFPKATTAAVVAFLFLPSFVFWTSGLLKESLAVPALLFLCILVLKAWFQERFNWKEVVTGFVALWVLWNLKYFYAGVFIPVVCTTLIFKKVVQTRFSFSAGTEAVVWLLIFTLPVAMASLLHPNFHFDRLFNVVVENNYAYVQLSDPGDFVRFHDLTSTLPGILINAPWALFSGLFRPLFWEVSAVIQFFAGIENTFLLLFFAGALMRIKTYKTSTHRTLIFAVIIYIILLCVFVTLSAPNFGTLSRYRAGYISFFAFLILCNNPFFEYVERSFVRLVRQ